MKQHSVSVRGTLFGLFACVVSTATYGEPIEMPVVTSIIRTSQTSTETNYDVQRVDMPTWLLDEPMGNGRIVVAYVDTGSQVSGGPYRGGLPEARTQTYGWFSAPDSAMTLRAYLAHLKDTGQMRGMKRLTWGSESLADLCHGFAISTRSQPQTVHSSTAQSAYSSALSYARYSWQPQCSELPPVAASCTLLDPEVVLNYGTLLRQQAAGRETSGALNVRCSATTKISLGTPTGGRVILSNGGVVTLTSGGHVVGDPALIYTAEADVIKTIPITAELTEPGRAGGFEGNTVISLRYP